MILTATGITKDADLDSRVSLASPTFEKATFQRQRSEVISAIDEPKENINLSWNAPEFYKRLKRFRRPQVESDTWNPNRWASCPEVVDPSPSPDTSNSGVRFYVGTSPSGRSINDEDEDERYRTYLYYLLSTTRSASSEIRFLDIFQEAQDNIRALPRQESNCTLDVILSSRSQLSRSSSQSPSACQRASWSSARDECFNRRGMLLGSRDDVGERASSSGYQKTYSQPVSPEGSRISVATISASVNETVTIPRTSNTCPERTKADLWQRAYDNPCFVTTGSPQSSFQDRLPTLCSAGQNSRVVAPQPAAAQPTDVLTQDRKCSVFDIRKINAILRSVFCCDCCVWDAGRAEHTAQS